MLSAGIVTALTRALRLRDDFCATLDPKTAGDDWYALSEEQAVALAEMDIVMMRKDPPFDMEYIYTTYLLERAEAEGVMVANRPSALRDCNEKLFATFPPVLPRAHSQPPHRPAQSVSQTTCKRGIQKTRRHGRRVDFSRYGTRPKPQRRLGNIDQ